MKMPFGSAIVEAASRLLTPFMLLFAVYVVVHGHDTPGGGFQGGVLFAAAIILMKLARGTGIEWGPDVRHALVLACTGTAIFAGIGLLGLLSGNYLDYGAVPLPIEGARRRALGTLGIEIGVALAVAGVLVLVFETLVAWGEEDG